MSNPFFVDIDGWMWVLNYERVNYVIIHVLMKYVRYDLDWFEGIYVVVVVNCCERVPHITILCINLKGFLT